MSKSAHLVAGESRWFALSVVLAAVTLTPAAAEASPKLANVKAKMGSKAACPVAAGQPQQAAPADISSAISGEAPSALDRIRAEQAGDAPVAASHERLRWEERGGGNKGSSTCRERE